MPPRGRPSLLALGDFSVILEGSNKMHTKVPISLNRGLERHELFQTMLQESSEDIFNSHDHPATISGHDFNERHTFVGLDGVPLMFISVEVQPSSSPVSSTQNCGKAL